MSTPNPESNTGLSFQESYEKMVELLREYAIDWNIQILSYHANNERRDINNELEYFDRAVFEVYSVQKLQVSIYTDETDRVEAALKNGRGSTEYTSYMQDLENYYPEVLYKSKTSNNNNKEEVKEEKKDDPWKRGLTLLW